MGITQNTLSNRIGLIKDYLMVFLVVCCWGLLIGAFSAFLASMIIIQAIIAFVNLSISNSLRIWDDAGALIRGHN